MFINGNKYGKLLWIRIIIVIIKYVAYLQVLDFWKIE